MALGLAILPTPAKADVWNQKTKFTFSEPVEIPGQVLAAGTYVFKLMDSTSDRNIVEVLNEREDHLYGIFLAIPDYRLKPADRSIITFEERAQGSPEAVRAWFYPGENYGHDFVYPKVKAMQLAKANNQPVPSMPDEAGGEYDQTHQEYERTACDGDEEGAAKGPEAEPGRSGGQRSIHTTTAQHTSGKAGGPTGARQYAEQPAGDG